VAKILQITGGSGSAISSDLEILTTVKVKFHIEAKFEDGTKGETELVRACTAKG
jgi:hypothetical protein